MITGEPLNWKGDSFWSWMHRSLTLHNLLQSLNEASRCFAPSHLASLSFDNHWPSVCHDPTCHLFLARGVILFHQVVSSHPSSAEGHLRLADFALEVPWNRFDVLPLSDPKSQKYVFHFIILKMDSHISHLFVPVWLSTFAHSTPIVRQTMLKKPTA